MFPLPNKAQKIIVAPLNWGLGHATRCIPIIRYCIDQGKKVILASDGEALELLSDEFPELEKIKLPGYNVKYKGKSLFSIVFNNSFNILNAIVKEHFALKTIVKEYSPDYILSDSRFGFWSNKIHSTFITHQLNLQGKNSFFAFLLNIVNRFFLNRFQEIWVLDNNDHLLSGKLSQNIKLKNTRFIGPVSRLKKAKTSIKYSLGIILSGPEPARSKLEEKLVNSLIHYKQSVILVRGTNNLSELEYPKGWIVKNRLDANAINNVILSSEKIISRSGYTSIMDYYLLKKSAILIPTPGQSEQEYLAEYLDGKFGFLNLNESNLNLLMSFIQRP
jgi:uncharacterized protein (TIGR00661 family)